MVDPLARQAAELAVLIFGASLPGIGQQLDDGVLARPGHAGDRTDGNALDHHGEDLGALGGGELVHASSL